MEKRSRREEAKAKNEAAEKKVRDKGKDRRDERDPPNPSRAQVRTDAEEATAQHEREMTQADRRSDDFLEDMPTAVSTGKRVVSLAKIPEVEKGEKVYKFKLGGTEGVHLRLPGDEPRVVDDKHKKSVEPTPVGEELKLSHRQVRHLRDHGICLVAEKPEEDVPQEIAA